MTAFHSESGIGARIQAARKLRGFKSARDLADAIPGGNITESILQNIEAGRKSDLSVSQLLNIALALRVAPAFLLAPLGRPSDPLDLPNLSEQFEAMTAAEFESWFSGTAHGSYRWHTLEERNERNELEALRELRLLVKEQQRLVAISEIEDRELGTKSDNGHHLARSFVDRIAEVTNEIELLRTQLTAAGWQID